MKLWSSVRGQAEKMAFEADKMVRVRREESAVSEARNEIQGKQLSIGQVALGLFRAGSLSDPQIAALAQEIAALEAAIQEHQERIVAIRAEQPKGAEQAAAAAEAPAAPPMPPQAPTAAPQAPAPSAEGAAAAEQPKSRFCPNCGKPVPAGAVFCPECGTRMS